MSVNVSLYVLRRRADLAETTGAHPFINFMHMEGADVLGQFVDLSERYDWAPRAPHIHLLACPVTFGLDLDHKDGVQFEDRMGTPWEFLPAKDFAKMNLPEDVDPRWKAIKAFMAELDPNTPVIFDWSF